MSNVSANHAVVPFVAGTSKAFSGQRLAKVGYKSTKNTPAKYPSIAVSVPFIQPDDVSANLSGLLPHIGAMIEAAQDGIIRSLYEGSDGSLRDVSDADISVSACIAFLDAEQNGSRLTTERIAQWFDSAMSDSLYVLIAEKLGFAGPNQDPTDSQDREVKKHVKIYKDVFSMLAGGKTVLQDKQIQGCKNALALIDSDDVSVKLNARLIAMEKKPVLAEMLELV